MPPAPITTHLQLVAGDDCKAADGRALSWPTSTTWPALAGATLTMTVGHDEYNLYGNLPLTWTGTVPTPSPSPLTLDVTAAQTAGLSADRYDYVLVAKLTNGDTVTLAAGYLTVMAPPTNLPLYPAAV